VDRKSTVRTENPVVMRRNPCVKEEIINMRTGKPG
jgi:hypothetical protein